MINCELFKALGDDTRLKIVTLLSKSRYCVKALSNMIGVSQPAISQHLKILRNTGLIKGEKIGYFTHYIVQSKVIKTIGEDLVKFSNQISKTECHHDCILIKSNTEEEVMEKKCKKPENMKTKDGKCTPEQIKICHGKVKKHDCEEEKKKK